MISHRKPRDELIKFLTNHIQDIILCSEISLNIIKINTYLHCHKNGWKACNHLNHAHQQRMLGLNIILGKLVNYIYVVDSSLKIFQ